MTPCQSLTFSSHIFLMTVKIFQRYLLPYKEIHHILHIMFSSISSDFRPLSRAIMKYWYRRRDFSNRIKLALIPHLVL